MNRALILNHLRLSQKHVARSEQQVARQREIVANLEHAGCDATVAKQLLASFEEALDLQATTLDRCRQEWQEITRPIPRWDTA